jgi:hypothetical protein
MMQYNVPIDALWAPVSGARDVLSPHYFSQLFSSVGPANPYNPRRGLAAANHFIGHVEVRSGIPPFPACVQSDNCQADGVDGYAFDEQRLKFNRTGSAPFTFFMQCYCMSATFVSSVRLSQLSLTSPPPSSSFWL